jgi:hypothetical protein
MILEVFFEKWKSEARINEKLQLQEIADPKRRGRKLFESFMTLADQQVRKELFILIERRGRIFLRALPTHY